MALTILDPTNEAAASGRPLAARRLSPGAPAKLALLDIRKPRGDVFLDRLAELLKTRGLRVERYRKPTFAKVAPLDLRHKIATTCDVIIEALAD